MTILSKVTIYRTNFTFDDIHDFIAPNVIFLVDDRYLLHVQNLRL